jgi:hypothetical protein
MCQTFIKQSLSVLALLFAVAVFSASCGCAKDVGMQDAGNEPMVEMADRDAPMGIIAPATAFYDQSISEYLGVGFVIENASTQGAGIRLENEYSYYVLLGYDFRIIVMEDDEAIRRAEPKEGLVVPAILSIPSEVPYLQEKYLDFGYHYGGLKPGYYRFVTSVYISDDKDTTKYKDFPSDFEEVSLYADFTIG